MSNASSPFGNRQGSGATWCRIAGGKIIRQAEEHTPGAVNVEIKEKGEPTGKFRWELHDDNVTGRITKLSVQSKEFHGEELRQLVVSLTYVGHNVNVTMKEGDRYWRAFMLRLPNVKLLDEVTFAPFDFESKEGNRIIGMNLLQHTEKVPPVWTKDNPGELPPMQRVVYKGKERADFTAQDEWLNQNVLLPVNAKLATIVVQAPAAVPAAPAPAAQVDEDDDLPW